MAGDPYVYPGTAVLRNRWNLREPYELARREAILTATRLIELADRPILGSFDLAHLQAIHRHVFGDIYPWAGEIRTVQISKGDELFALPQHIQPYLSEVLNHLPGENHLRGLEREAFLDRITHYYSEINAAHAFREGNGRAQRAFLGQLADQAGHHIAWDRVELARNIEASRAAHHGASRPMRGLLSIAVDDHRAQDEREERDRADDDDDDRSL